MSARPDSGRAQRVGTAGEVGADPEFAALQDRPRPVLTRHCWVTGLPECPGRWAGLLAEWRQDTEAGGWQGRLVYAVDDGGDGAGRGVGARPPPAAGWLAGRTLIGVCGDLPRGCSGGEFVDAGPALGDVLAVFLCPLGVALALLAQPRPQVLGLGVGAIAQLVAVGCPRAVMAGSAGSGKPEGTWARLDAGPRCRAQAVSARSSGAVPVSSLQRPRIVRAAFVTVSAACRT